MNCTKCGRPTFAGCGAHIEQVLGDVAVGDRCKCREASATRPQDATAAGPPTKSWLSALLGK
ncbi:MAG: hypothetical protein Q8Q09_18295 [Deltaproteobacteria bacterium]|nr:hypothetical protein [Deltaproteobacteria bacterium]